MHNARAHLDAAVLRQHDLDEEKRQLAKSLASVREVIQRDRDAVKEQAFEQENLTTRIRERHQEDLREVHIRYLTEEITERGSQDEAEAAQQKIERFGEVNLMAHLGIQYTGRAVTSFSRRKKPTS